MKRFSINVSHIFTQIPSSFRHEGVGIQELPGVGMLLGKAPQGFRFGLKILFAFFLLDVWIHMLIWDWNSERWVFEIWRNSLFSVKRDFARLVGSLVVLQGFANLENEESP